MAKNKGGIVMKKVKKVITNMICIVIIIICGGIIWVGIQVGSQHHGSLSSWIRQRQRERNQIVREKEPSGTIAIPHEIIEGVHFGENGENYCLLVKILARNYEWIDEEYMWVKSASLRINAKYIVGYHRIEYDSREWIEKATYEDRIKNFVLYITRTDGEEIQTKEIDLQKVFEKTQYFPNVIRRVIERNGKSYVELNVVSRSGSKEGKNVLFDLEKETVIENKAMFFEHSIKGIYISELSEHNIAFIDISTGNGMFSHYSVENLLQSSLVHKYPEIRELIERNEIVEMNDGDYMGAIVYFEKVEDPDEIIRLFEKEGVDPFENAELEERDTKDGKRHKINSFEDFLEWYDFSESQKEEVEMLLAESEE